MRHAGLVLELYPAPKGWRIQLWQDREPLGADQPLRQRQEGTWRPITDPGQAQATAKRVQGLMFPGARLVVREAT